MRADHFRGATKKPPAPIDDAERARIAGNVAGLREQCPELVPFFKDLHAEGLVDGWRAIDYVGPHRPPPASALSLDKIMLGFFNPANAKERNKWD